MIQKIFFCRNHEYYNNYLLIIYYANLKLIIVQFLFFVIYL